VVAIPQSGLLAHVSSLRLPSGHSGLVLTLSNAARASLPTTTPEKILDIFLLFLLSFFN